MSAAWLFDLDGTLVDTAPDLAGAANALRLNAGLAALPVAHYRAYVSSGARGLIARGLDIAPEDPRFAALRSAFLDHYAAHLGDNSPLFAGLEPVLRFLEARDIAWGVVTNKPKRLTDALLAALHLTERAAVVVSADEVALAKPAPDALLLACTRAALDPARCFYVGDDLRDMVAGRAAGMITIAAEWGYLGETAPELWQADHRCPTPDHLLDLMVHLHS